MSLIFDFSTNLPPASIHHLNASFNIDVRRQGDFYKEKKGPGCGCTVFWNGAGFYNEGFQCGTSFPTGFTFYCSDDCYNQIGETSKVFLSYRWENADIADKIERCLKAEGIELLRDKSEVGFMENIENFMSQTGAGRFFVCVLTTRYFLSRHCMFELMQLMRSSLDIRVLPLTIGDALAESNEASYIDHWRKRHAEVREIVLTIAADPKHLGAASA